MSTDRDKSLIRRLRRRPPHATIEHVLRQLDESEISEGRDCEEHEEKRRKRDEAEPDADEWQKRKNDCKGDRSNAHEREKLAGLAAKEQPPCPDTEDDQGLGDHRFDEPARLKQAFAGVKYAQ